MKRGLIFFVIALFLIFSFEVFAEITGEAITGEATSQPVGMNISIFVPLPVLNLITPKNHTYVYPDTILLNYSVTGTNQVWYNLDDAANITLSGNTQFSSSPGGHVLKIYANNSKGTVIKNVSFFVNSSELVILYSEYNGTKKGDSTNFSVYSYEDLQNMSSIILENSEFGKILFNEIINVSNDEFPNDNIVDLDSYTNISHNRIELNSSALPNFNKSCTLFIHGLSFSNPRILIGGNLCPASICAENSYSGGILSFNVTGFDGIYSAQETPGVVSSPPSGGGGGGSVTRRIKDFDFDTNMISVSLKQGENTSREVIIRNTGNQKINISLKNSGLENFLKLSESGFELNHGETKKIILEFKTKEDSIPELYLGKILVKSEKIEKEIIVALEIESKKVLFDVKLNIPRKFRSVSPGEEVLTDVEIFNLGNIGRVDVVLEYSVRNSDGEEIIFETETVAVETRASLIKTFELPANIHGGEYVIYVRAVYQKEVGGSTAWFGVGKKLAFIKSFSWLIGMILGIVIFLVIFYMLNKNRIDVLIFKGKEKIQEIRYNRENTQFFWDKKILPEYRDY